MVRDPILMLLRDGNKLINAGEDAEDDEDDTG
jgi:hypothetical protein